MKKVVIYGAGKAGQHVLHEIKKFKHDWSVIAFLDAKLPIDAIELVPVYRPDEYMKNADADLYIIAAGNQKVVYLLMTKLLSYEVDNIYFLQDIAGKNELHLFEEDGKICSNRLRKIKFGKKPTLPYFEIPITDVCNLNCKGCLFACNQEGESQEEYAVGEIKRDLRRMHELFEDVLWVRLLGGEPLMHPELKKIVTECRKIFKKSEIDLCTNALLLPTIQDDVLKTMYKNGITVHISGYKPTYRVLEKATQRLDAFDIEWTVLRRDSFYKFYTQDNSHDPKIEMEKCPTVGCHELYKGRFLKCSAVLAFEQMNRQFDTDYIVKEDVDWIDIHKDVDPWNIMHALNHGAGACAYCDVDAMENFEWEMGTQAKLEDYLVG